MPPENSKIRVALVQDWLVATRGAERVLDALCELFPQAEIFTLFHRKRANNAKIENRVIHTSFLNRLPWVDRYYRLLLPIMPLAIENLRLQGFDLVISVSHSVSKGVIPDPTALHICYCHTPLRACWDPSEQYFGKDWKTRLLTPFLHYLRIWDVASSTRVDHFIANSDFTGRRIEKYYHRKSLTIYPFVDLERFKTAKTEKQDYYLFVSGFTPYKQLELALRACHRLNRRLLILGEGPSKKLRKIAGPLTEFLGMRPESDLPTIYTGARALLVPGIEDFGIAPLEAMACGTPVIAYGAGGALETVKDGKTGLFFHEATVESLAAAIKKFETLRFPWAENCREHAKHFSRNRFQTELMGRVNAYLETRKTP